MTSKLCPDRFYHRSCSHSRRMVFGSTGPPPQPQPAVLPVDISISESLTIASNYIYNGYPCISDCPCIYIYIICNIIYIYIHIQKRTYQLSFPPLEAICYFGIVFEDSHFLVVSLFQFRPAMKSQMAVLPARRSVNLWLRGSQILSPVALEKERGFEAFEAYSDLASL